MEKMDTLDLAAREQVLKIRVHGASVPPHRREVIGRLSEHSSPVPRVMAAQETHYKTNEKSE